MDTLDLLVIVRDHLDTLDEIEDTSILRTYNDDIKKVSFDVLEKGSSKFTIVIISNEV